MARNKQISEQLKVDRKELLANKKVWYCHDDICFLYGPVSKDTMLTIRKKRLVRYTMHPFNQKEFMYWAEDIDNLIEYNLIEKKDRK